MKYKKGYKYQLYDTEYYKTKIIGFNIKTDWIQLREDGFLTILKGYAWDGPSGPTIDTKTFMRGSIVHDSLYELMRKELLPITFKGQADQYLYDICIEDGMWIIRAWWVYNALGLFGKQSTLPKNKKVVYETG